jgi:diguanylate cyclase (GGDEF)-like protein/PAS domain S-box-containing protein
VWFEVTNHNLLNDPAHGYVLTEMLDISEEMATQEALRSRERLLHGLAEALPLGVLQIDRQGRIEYRNARVATLLGSGSAEHLAEQLATVLPAHRADVDAAVRCVLQEGGERDLEIAVAHGPHDIRCLHLSLRALRGDAGAITGAIVCLTDVTDSVRMREQLKDRATFDTLTRCYNRASILHLLQRTLAESPSSDGLGTAVIFVDLDHFKQINDHRGHAAGDTFLIEVAHCLQQSVRDGDAVGRLGGDEFLIVCAGLESATKAVRLAQRIARSLRTTAIAIGREQIVASASIGVAWSSAPTSADALVARADQAMYESKRLGRSRPVLAECQAPVRRAA